MSVQECNKTKRIMTAMAVAAAMMMALPGVAYASEFSSDGSTAVPVNASISSSYTVSLPASFTLTKQMSEADIDEMYDQIVENARAQGADEETIASFEKERKKLKAVYSANGNVGVKGNFPTDKAVVVVAYDGAVDENGVLTEEAIANGTAKFQAVNSAFISSRFGMTPDGAPDIRHTETFTLKKASNGARQTENTINGETIVNELHMSAVRWASPALDESDLVGAENLTGYRVGEMKARTEEYAMNGIQVEAVLTDADAYSGYVGFTFGLTDRN